MIESYIKYFFILTCAFYYFQKLLNLQISKKRYIINFICLFLSTTFIFFTRMNFSQMTAMVLFIAVYVHTSITFQVTPKITMITSLLSLAISYFMFYFSTLLFVPVVLLIPDKYRNLCLFYPLSIILIGGIQLYISHAIFKIKRLKRGMPFLLEKIPNAIGILISCFIIFLSSFFTMLNNENYFYALLFPICTILGFILFIWWRKQLTISYLNRAHQNEISRLEEELEKVKKDNEHLGKLIHKDNKLIPAMEMAVKSLLSEPYVADNEDIYHKASDLLTNLNQLTKERVGILNASHRKSSLPVTGLVRLDSVISYMYEKALSKNIKLDASIDIDVQEMVNKSISEDVLVTLIADLTENAIIATKNTDTKNILLTLGIENKNYCVSIFDSGIPFEPYTIENAGIKKASTHLDDGGSGIGLMTTFALLKECRASFIIDETTGNEHYTKKISIMFDCMNEFRVNSQREEVLAISHNRPDIVFNQ